jgi:S-adenosylmethionine decarboxylase
MSNESNRDYALGKHITIEFYECNSAFLADSVRMESAFVAAARESGATVLTSSFHSFKPQGVSGVVIIAESHFSVHAWPEHDYAAVDIFTCSEAVNCDVAIESLRRSMSATGAVISNLMNRGIVTNNGMEKLLPIFEDRTYLYALSWRKRFEESKAWGLLVSTDIYNCDKQLIQSAAAIRIFVNKLCETIGLKQFGACNIEHFGDNEKVEGFSMTQFLETSLVSGHFVNANGTTYLDIFSCKFFEPRTVAEMATEYFHGNHYRMQVALRK